MSIELPAEFIDKLADAVAAKLALRIEQPEQWPEWMSVPTAARYLDCGEHRLYKLAERGQIPHVRDGARVFFERQALDDWMTAKVSSASGKNPPTPTASVDVVR